MFLGHLKVSYKKNQFSMTLVFKFYRTEMSNF